MPYVNPPVCFICGKVHPCDTEDTVQLTNAKFVTVNICKSHPGVIEEHERQQNLQGEERAEHARKVISTPEFHKIFHDYTDHLAAENPQHAAFLQSL